MSEQEQKELFARNLNIFLERSNKTQKEVADAIGVSPQTFNTWCQGIAFPRMGKVQLLADYFQIEKVDLLTPNGPALAQSRRLEAYYLRIFNSLNKDGKEKVLDFASALAQAPTYSAKVESALQAAHERTDIDVTDEMRKHDDDIMDDENF